MSQPRTCFLLHTSLPHCILLLTLLLPFRQLVQFLPTCPIRTPRRSISCRMPIALHQDLCHHTTMCRKWHNQYMTTHLMEDHPGR
ncbi:uncharacterized protein PHACADRAFT_260184 [Phanerochaete carnosa HHB-10118-sp]|uniref:C2H2-type domain-containing protein n=1 Tax=Phanerochaete carnosa (strain HHB-10118-sp) TaxID=650164 RepID=K5W422_PHACS|nr:uncharacterized protein PHACADRAFT_260184 [Phanerochaete carnosa HHB-10118-sp]EKM53694.1 hypothetical protein PHACADRAFT_260184 [Phanerochaete carnosa HHB-10118-sp]